MAHTYRGYDQGMIWTFLRMSFAALGRIGYRAGNRVHQRIPNRLGPMRGVHQEAVFHEDYSLQARLVQRAARIFIQPILRFAPMTPRAIAFMRRLERRAANAPRSRYVEARRVLVAGIPAESMRHRYGPPSDATILYLHGGGFMFCGIETHRRICERLAKLTGAEVVSLDYKQLPEGPVADSVNDAINAYEAVLATCPDPSKVIVAGDSAGGYLSMKVAELATRRGITRPAAVLGFSPLLSVDPDRPDKGVERIDPVNDAYLPPSRMPRIRSQWLPIGARIEGRDSPLDATEWIESPVFMTATEDEMLRPEVEEMARRLAERGQTVEIHLWRKQVHAFPVMADVLPESREALQLAANFVAAQTGRFTETVACQEPGVA